MDKLTQSECQSALWAKVKEHLEARLDFLRKSNDNAKSWEDVLRNQGRISEVKKLLSLGKKEELEIEE